MQDKLFGVALKLANTFAVADSVIGMYIVYAWILGNMIILTFNIRDHEISKNRETICTVLNGVTFTWFVLFVLSYFIRNMM